MKEKRKSILGNWFHKFPDNCFMCGKEINKLAGGRYRLCDKHYLGAMEVIFGVKFFKGLLHGKKNI